MCETGAKTTICKCALRVHGEMGIGWRIHHAVATLPRGGFQHAWSMHPFIKSTMAAANSRLELINKTTILVGTRFMAMTWCGEVLVAETPIIVDGLPVKPNAHRGQPSSCIRAPIPGRIASPGGCGSENVKQLLRFSSPVQFDRILVRKALFVAFRGLCPGQLRPRMVACV